MKCNSGAGPLPVVELPLCDECHEPLEFPRPEERDVCFLCVALPKNAAAGATPTPKAATADDAGQYMFAL